MHKKFLAIAAVTGGLAVVLGAFGAHSLEGITKDEKILHGFQTGVQYQMFHSLALLAVALLFDKLPLTQVKWAGYCFITGIILFSGSLYLITFFKIQESLQLNMPAPLHLWAVFSLLPAGFVYCWQP